MGKHVARQQAKPEPLSEGRYALFETAAGGALLVFRPDGAAADGKQLIPPPVWQIMKRAAAGEQISPATVLKSLAGTGRR